MNCLSLYGFLVEQERLGVIELLPGLDENSVRNLPAGMRELARRTSGFYSLEEHGDPLLWDRVTDSGYLHVVESVVWHMDIGGGDGAGNNWVLLLDPESGEPKEVLWISHDPTILSVAADSFDRFCQEYATDTEALWNRTRAAEDAIWRTQSEWMSIDQARVCSDAAVREFAAELSGDWRIFDLRPEQVLRGFRHVSDGDIHKHESSLLFAERQSPKRPNKPWWKLW